MSSIYSFTDHAPPPAKRRRRTDYVPPPVKRRGRFTGADGTVWVQTRARAVGREADDRRRALNAKITYVSEKAARTTGLPPERLAGVPKPMFDAWRRNRDFFYCPGDDLDKTVEKRMALDGYTPVRVRPRDKDLLITLGEAYKLYKVVALAHGIPHPDPC